MDIPIQLTSLYDNEAVGNALRGYGGLGADANLYGFQGNTTLSRIRQLQDPAYKAALKARRNELQVNKFQAGFPGTDTFMQPVGNIQMAMRDLASYLGAKGVTVMFDANGYFGYLVSSEGNRSVSTNLSRLRRVFSGLAIGEQPKILGNLGVDLPLAKNKVWTAVIAWHKFLNASNGYSNKYRSLGVEGAYSRAMAKSRSNLQKSFVELAQPGELEKRYTKLSNGFQKQQEMYQKRFARLNYVRDNREAFRAAVPNAIRTATAYQQINSPAFGQFRGSSFGALNNVNEDNVMGDGNANVGILN